MGTQEQLRGGHPHGRHGASRCGNGPLRLGLGGIHCHIPALRHPIFALN